MAQPRFRARRFSACSVTALAAIWSFGAAAPAFAQDAAPEAAAPADEGEILVTARRREESLQDTPISISA